MNARLECPNSHPRERYVRLTRKTRATIRSKADIEKSLEDLFFVPKNKRNRGDVITVVLLSVVFCFWVVGRVRLYRDSNFPNKNVDVARAVVDSTVDAR